MPQTDLQTIRELVREGDLENCLRRLLLWAELQRMEEARLTAELRLSQLNRLEKELMKGLLTREQYDAEFNRIAAHALNLLDECEDPAPAAADDSVPPAGNRRPLHANHAFTCDRVDQSDAFDGLFQGKAAKKQKAQFYYLYGWEPQSHRGMFRRIAFEREGGLLALVDARSSPLCKTRCFEIKLKRTRREDIFRQELVKTIFAALQVPFNEHEPLLQKDLRYIVDHSPLLSEFREEDFVCLYIPIGSYDWDERVTPQVARWFFQDFCGVELPAGSPTFLFFFAVVFEVDEEDEGLVEEIRETVENSDLIHPLPELNRVSRRDIRRWFRFFSPIAPTSEQRQALLTEHFGENENEFDMETVQLKLNRIIDDFNRKSGT